MKQHIIFNVSFYMFQLWSNFKNKHMYATKLNRDVDKKNYVGIFLITSSVNSKYLKNF
jgi:hypothetical protein